MTIREKILKYLKDVKPWATFSDIANYYYIKHSSVSGVAHRMYKRREIVKGDRRGPLGGQTIELPPLPETIKTWDKKLKEMK